MEFERPAYNMARSNHVISLAFVAIIGAAAVCSFVGLNASSLWLDELFTAYFTDARIGTPGELVLRAAEDVHPPVYYLILWAVLKLFGGDFTIVSRGLSATFAILSLPVLYHAFPQQVGRFARLFACAFAATSLVWFVFSQEARSYALVFLIVSAMLGCAFRVRDKQRRGEQVGGPLAGLVLVSIIGGLTHYYVVPLAGGIFATLILLSRSWSERARLAGAGLLVLAPIVAFMTWQSERIVADVTDTWFQATRDFLADSFIDGVKSEVGSIPRLVLIGMLIVGAAVGYARATREKKTQPVSPFFLDLLFVAVSAALGVFLALAVTLLVVPSFSPRFFLILAPCVWLAAGLLAEQAARVLTDRSFVLFAGMLAALMSLDSLRAFWRGLPTKEPWRESAAQIRPLSACADAVIPVVSFERPYTSGNSSNWSYGFYLHHRRWLELPRNRLTEAVNSKPVSALVRKRLAGTDPCPVLLWSVHPRLTLEKAQELTALMISHADHVAGRVVIRSIEPKSFGPLQRALGLRTRGSSILVLVEH